jgi:hypothetical protein
MGITEAVLQRGSLPQQKVAQETLVFCPGGGVVVLNETAQELLELCDGSRSRAEVMAAFVASYPGEDPPQLAREAGEVLDELLQHEIIITAPPREESPA